MELFIDEMRKKKTNAGMIQTPLESKQREKQNMKELQGK